MFRFLLIVAFLGLGGCADQATQLPAGGALASMGWQGLCDMTGGAWDGAPGAECEGNLLAALLAPGPSQLPAGD